MPDSWREVPRCGGHEQPTATLDLLIVEDCGELTRNPPSAAVRLIRDRKVEGWCSAAVVSRGDLRCGLVGGEHDPPAATTQKCRDRIQISCNRHPEPWGVLHHLVRADNRLIRADSQILKGLSRVRTPLAQRLGKQRERRQKHKRSGAVKSRSNPKPGQRLTRPAGHNQLAGLWIA